MNDEMDDLRQVFANLLFANGWSDGQAGLVANRFLVPIRNGENNPTLVCRAVMLELSAEIKRCRVWGAEAEQHKALFRLMQENSQAALGYARYYIWWESLLKFEKEQHRAPKREQFKDEWMEQQPPTQKQLDLIAAKGYEGELPDNRWSASKLIDRLLKGRR